MASNLNDMIIKNLKTKEKEYTRREKGGFGVRVHPSGTKTFFYLYRVDGKRRFLNLGEYKDKQHPNGITLDAARGQYVIESGKVTALKAGRSEGRDPVKQQQEAAKRRKQVDAEELKALTVEGLIKDYLEKHAQPKKKSWREDERILNKDVLPVWGFRKAKDITRRDVILLLDGMQGRGNGIITNTFKIIRRMFRYAVKKEIISTTPCYAFERGEELPRPVSRERNLTEAEVKAFWTELDNCAISESIRKILRLILLTSQRPGEVCAMHSTDIDGRWWEFTPKETKITKEIPRKQRVYLSDAALALIGPLEVFDEKTGAMKPRGFIFKCHTDSSRCITERAITYALRRNLLTHEVKPKPATWQKTRIKPKRKNPFIIPDDKKLDIEKFTPHDLRRTGATIISELGYSDAIVDAILAHLKKGEIRTYNKNKYDKEKQEALEEWALKLTCIVDGTEYRNRLQREADQKIQEIQKQDSNVIDIQSVRRKKVA